MMTKLERIKELAQNATRWTAVVTRNNHRSFTFEEVEAEVVLAMVECIEVGMKLHRIVLSIDGEDGLMAAQGEFNEAIRKLEQMK